MAANAVYLARIPATTSPPAAAPAVLIGQNVQLSAYGAGGAAASPGPIVTLWHADLAGPQLPAGTMAVVMQTAGGNWYVCAAPGIGYVGKTPTAIDAQLNFTGF